MQLGLKKVRDTVEAAAARVTESGESIARGIGVAIGVAVLALVLAVAALLRGPKARLA